MVCLLSLGAGRREFIVCCSTGSSLFLDVIHFTAPRKAVPNILTRNGVGYEHWLPQPARCSTISSITISHCIMTFIQSPFLKTHGILIEHGSHEEFVTANRFHGALSSNNWGTTYCTLHWTLTTNPRVAWIRFHMQAAFSNTLPGPGCDDKASASSWDYLAKLENSKTCASSTIRCENTY